VIGSMQQQQPVTWLSRLWPWHPPADPDAVRAARQAVAKLKPAVVVTGGSRGIGFALARRFLQAGREAAIVARDATRLTEATAALLIATGAEPTPIVCDVTRHDALDIIAARLRRAGLYLDVLVNNAGIGLAGPFLTHTPDDLSHIIALNIETVTRLTRAALPDMVARQRGGILNMASLGGHVPGPNQAAYYASKAYVLSLTEAIANEVAWQGVRVAAVLPGPVETKFHADMGAETSLYRVLLPSLTPEATARSAYRGFMLGRRVIVPGLLNNGMYLALKLLPHCLTVPVVSWLLRRPENLSPR
jgi:short-subunit dehydrogenase